MKQHKLSILLDKKAKIQKKIKREFGIILTPFEERVKIANSRTEIFNIKSELYRYLGGNDISCSTPQVLMFEDYCNRMLNVV